MEKLKEDLKGKRNLLLFTLGKSESVLASGNVQTIKRHREALSSIADQIDALKLQVVEEMFKTSDSEETIGVWSDEIEKEIGEVDTRVTYINERLANLKLQEDTKTQESESELKAKEREEQLRFERAQLEQKLEYERKIEETKKNYATKSSETKASPASEGVRTKLPKLTITKFNGSHTDWLRFWNIYEAEIDKCSDMAAVTKFAYLKDLLEPKVRAGIDGLPFSSEGYERAKNILRNKYGKMSEIVNGYVQNIMGLPVISGANPAKIHQFYEALSFNVQALETLGKLREVNGYVRMSIDKLPGIRGDLVRMDENWQEWDFPKFVYALQGWTERNPVTMRSCDKPWRDSNAFNTQLDDVRLRDRGCVYCDSADHKPHECTKVPDLNERKKIFMKKRLCFNCAGDDHRASECRSKKTCLFCKRRHHTSICDRGNTDNSMTATQIGDGPVVYPVVVVEVAGIKCRALLDSGAGSSYASAALLDRIRAKPHHSGMRKIEMMLGATSRVMEVYRIKLNSVKGNFEIEAEVTKVEKPCLMLIDNPRYKKLVEKHPHLKGVTMDDNDERPRLPVHLILGNSECPRISTTEPQRVGGEWDPVANYTKLGWTITSPGKEIDTTSMLLTQTSRVDYEDLCKLDVLGLADSPSGDQGVVYDEFKEQLRRSDEGWYETGLPWKGNHTPLPNNKEGSLRRLASLVRKLEKNGTIEDYNAVIQEQLTEGIVERAPNSVEGREFYIPHKGVVRETAESTKLRIVYDASARAWDGAPSLNECLNTGPPLQNQLWSVLIRGRFNPVAITGDIKKAFLQVRIRSEERDALRFHWINTETKEIETLRFTRALFGLGPSPFLLGGVIEQHLDTWTPKKPDVVSEIKKNLYVDDLISGGTTVSKAREMKQAATEIFADAAFELHKWHSSVPELESAETDLNADQTFAKQQLGGSKGGESSMLGLKWNKLSDVLSVTVPTEKAENTKRGILAKVARIYDPLGVASPLTLCGKLLYRDACNLRIGWDEQLPSDLADKWAKWESRAPERITFKRALVQYQEPISSISLHVFGDASGMGVAATAYTVVSQPSGVTQGIVAAKARLAKQGLTIPRLELVACHMATNLANNVKEALEGYPVVQVYCWSDSTVALHWIRGEGDYKQFVHNRVRKIQDKNWITWRHVPTKENPADLGSRGGPVAQDDDLWWRGPKWLSDPSAWPVDITTTATAEALAEAKTVREIFKLANEQEVEGIDAVLNKYGLWRVLRIGGWMARFIHNAKHPVSERRTGPLTTEELTKQRRFLEKRAQREGMNSGSYENDRLQLNLQLNDQQLLECRGRIQGVYPVYLPDTAVYTEKFVEEAHEATLHGGTQLTMTKVRERHWVPRLRRLVKKIVKKCPRCKRFQATALTVPPPGLLPRDRTEGSTPFEVVGVDYAGPIKYKATERREGKAYLILYACSLTRALYLDLARTLESSEFLLSLKGFIARRGRPSTIYSDNGSTFIGAAAWIKQVQKDEKLNDYLARHQIIWKFNLSRAPWWGGQFERLIGVVKTAMRKTIGNACLTFDELREVLLDVEIALNGRPLSYVEDDAQLPVLTPHSMLFSQPNILPEREVYHEEIPHLKRRAKYLKKCKDAMWNRWTKEYLRGLRERHTVAQKDSPCGVQKGDVCLIKDDNKDRNKWKLGIVEELIVGRDGVVRAVKLRAGKSYLERAVQQLYPLELSCDKSTEAENPPLNPEAPAFRPRRDAAVAARLRVQEIAERDQDG